MATSTSAARTDAAGVTSVDEAIARCQLFMEAAPTCEADGVDTIPEIKLHCVKSLSAHGDGSRKRRPKARKPLGGWRTPRGRRDLPLGCGVTLVLSRNAVRKVLAAA